MTEHIKQTRYPELGYANYGRACWRIVDRSDNRVVGPIYKTKAELLADLDRYAAVFGCEPPMTTEPYDESDIVISGQPLQRPTLEPGPIVFVRVYDEQAKVYAEGGIGFEHRVKGIGWVVDDQPSALIARYAMAIRKLHANV
jgi:hypothetical protein